MNSMSSTTLRTERVTHCGVAHVDTECFKARVVLGVGGAIIFCNDRAPQVPSLKTTGLALRNMKLKLK